jgi:hypothetical protein
VEKQSPVFIDHAYAGRTELQGFAKLPLVLGRLYSKSAAAFGHRR